MKKRALSLLLACFMVVSTFIISRPLVDVHAVEFSEGENQWTLPYNWSKDNDTYVSGGKTVHAVHYLLDAYKEDI